MLRPESWWVARTDGSLGAVPSVDRGSVSKLQTGGTSCSFPSRTDTQALKMADMAMASMNV